MRGKPHPGSYSQSSCGLIPACAGKTLSHPHFRGENGAHPRVCGENLGQDPLPPVEVGSSPRVRGKRPGRLGQVFRVWLIPACAGKTLWGISGLRSRPAHPRVCGENGMPKIRAICVVGSSPRVRGKRYSRVKQLACLGLIPACAGKTTASESTCTPWKAHPRVCGENLHRLLRRRDQPGSSPRVRGKPLSGGSYEHCLGLIPACAGKT